MYGNVLTNRQLCRLMAERHLHIKPFSASSLKEAAYTLNPGRVLRMNEEGHWSTVHEFSARRSTFMLAADEYVIVEPKQTVTIDVDGILGTFIQASTNVEQGLLIVAGQVDSKYGTGGEALRFGVKNLLPFENSLSQTTRLVHMQLIDLRGSASDPVTLTAEQESVRESRRRDSKFERDDSDGPLPSEA